MRHDVKASLRSQPQTAAPIGRGRARRRRTALRGLLALPIALMLLAPGVSALATETTTGYSQTPPPPTTTTTTTTTTPTTTAKTTPATKTEPTSTPKGGVSPSSTSSTPKTTPTPASSKEPAKSSTEPTATTAKATTLPFTGLDLRWVVLAGVLLVGLGLSIMVAQRSRRGPER
jgi:uncharacterized membrane protein